MRRILFKLLLLTLIFFQVSAQSNSISLTVEVSNVPSGVDVNGFVVSVDKGNYQLSSKKGDPNIVGVITLNPSITLRKSTNTNVYDINTTGISVVKASNSLGKITKGDYVTSSDKLGIAVRSADSEYVIGTALEDFDSP